MIDYSEGCTSLTIKVKNLYDALLNKRFSEARDLCAEISTEARLIDKQIVIQFPDETGFSNVIKMPVPDWTGNDAA
jgi:hypothetical protein